MATSNAYNTTCAKLKENLTCPVCFELYNEDDLLPKCMPCQHTCCVQCILKLVRKNTKNLKCPLCQVKFAVPPGGVKDLPTNVTIINMLDVLPDENNNEDDVMKGSKPLCQAHAYKECAFVCTQCKIGLCNTCMTTMTQGPHYAHMDSVDELDVAMNEVKNEAKALSEKLQKLAEGHIDKVAKTQSEAKKWKTSLKQEVTNRVKMMNGSIKQWQREMNTEIDDRHQNVNVTLRNVIDEKETLDIEIAIIQDLCPQYNLNVYNILKEVSKQVIQIETDINKDTKDKVPTLQLSHFVPATFGSLKKDSAKLIFLINDVEGFSKRRVRSPLYGQHWYLYSLPWRIMVRSGLKGGKNKTLSVYVECDPSFIIQPGWSCKATVALKIVRHDPALVPFRRNFDATFARCENKLWGYEDLVEWETLMDAGETFVKDNSIMIEADIVAEEPKGLD